MKERTDKVDFCDYQDNDGRVCNRTPVYIVKDEEFNVYLCERCVHMYAEDFESDASYLI